MATKPPVIHKNLPVYFRGKQVGYAANPEAPNAPKSPQGEVSVHLDDHAPADQFYQKDLRVVAVHRDRFGITEQIQWDLMPYTDVPKLKFSQPVLIRFAERDPLLEKHVLGDEAYAALSETVPAPIHSVDNPVEKAMNDAKEAMEGMGIHVPDVVNEQGPETALAPHHVGKLLEIKRIEEKSGLVLGTTVAVLGGYHINKDYTSWFYQNDANPNGYSVRNDTNFIEIRVL